MVKKISAFYKVGLKGSTSVFVALLIMVSNFLMLTPVSAFYSGENYKVRGDMMFGGERSTLFNDGWRFSIGTNSGAEASAYDDSAWKEVELPHDWLIHQINDLYKSDIAWYRNTFYLPEDFNMKDIAIKFDGVYMDSTVYVNGQNAGNWPNGYNTFQFDITKFLKFGNEPNVIAVRVNHQAPNSRWYSGAGIYRNVWLTVTNPVHVDFNGTYISTDDDTVSIETEVINTSSSSESAVVIQTVLDADGNEIATSQSAPFTIASGKVVTDTQELTVNSPTLWDLDNPYLYTMKTQIKVGDIVCDEYNGTFGFRTILADPNEGFFLNGEYMKLHGVNMHHDLGALGSAVNYRAIERQMEIMKEMGVNAIRTAHNMPAPELMEICDRLGLLVINEAFDMWKNPKNANDFARFFNEWAQKDVKNWIKRDRNHPSVIMWSIGNEISDTKTAPGVPTAKMLKDYVLDSDPKGNAILTIGSNYMELDSAIQIGRELGSAGYNYIEHLYDEHHEKYPDMAVFASESASAVRSRGVYHFPPDESILRHFDQQCSSYDNSVVDWGASAENAWKYDRDRKFVLGQFVWTGFDYIGEPTPYFNKNSYFGIVDTAGLPKDIYYFYQSVWSDKDVLHLLPHWDWEEGDIIPVWAYTNADSVELFLNGESLGKKEVDLMGDVLHTEWKVPYKEGTLVAKSYDADGNLIMTDTISSFGDGAKLDLSPDRTDIKADGEDLVFVETSILDENDIFVANARNRVEFKVSGAGKLVGIDNGDSTDYEPYQAPARKAFSGKLVAIVQSDGTGGEITITATSTGMEPVSITVNAEKACEVESISLSSINGTDEIAIAKGSLKLQTAVNPANADYNKVSYFVTNTDGTPTDKAYINSSGVLTAYKDGTVKIKAVALDGSGQEAELDIKITNQAVFNEVAEIAISPANEAQINTKYGTLKMSAAITPGNAANKKIKWSVRNKESGDVSLAEIDASGLLQARYDGTVVVRAEATDGTAVYAEREVVLTNQCSQIIPIHKVSIEVLEGDSSLVGAGDYAKVKAVVYPAGANENDIEWSIMTEDGMGTSTAASVKTNSDGTATVTGKFNGSFTVCASSKNGNAYIQAFGLLGFEVSGLVEVKMNAYERIRGIDYSFGSKVYAKEGSSSDQSMGGVRSGDWCAFKYVDFGENGSTTMYLRAGRADAGNATIEIRSGSVEGELLATLLFDKVSSNWMDLRTNSYEVPGIKGVHDIYIIFKSGGLLLNGFWFDEAEPVSVTKGDVNEDDKINIFDIMKMRDHIFGKTTLEGDNFLAADINDDDKINIFDIMLVRDYIFGKVALQ